VRYTRAGNFHFDGQGRLVTTQGQSVLGSKGPIVAPQGKAQFSPDGTVHGSDGQVLDTLSLVSLKGLPLVAKGNGLYAPAQSGSTPPSTQAQVLGGTLEGSAADPFSEMASLVTIMRMAEAAQKTAQATDNAAAQAIQAMKL